MSKVDEIRERQKHTDENFGKPYQSQAEHDRAYLLAKVEQWKRIAARKKAECDRAESAVQSVQELARQWGHPSADYEVAFDTPRQAFERAADQTRDAIISSALELQSRERQAKAWDEGWDVGRNSLPVENPYRTKLAGAALLESDAKDAWTNDPLPGGWVCSVCGMPTESEPCPTHRPAAYRSIQ